MKIAQSKTKLGKNVVRNVCHKVIKLFCPSLMPQPNKLDHSSLKFFQPSLIFASKASI